MARYQKKMSLKEKIKEYITESLLWNYLDIIERNGKVLTTAKIYFLLSKSGAMGKDLDKVEIAETDDSTKLKMELEQKITDKLV